MVNEVKTYIKKNNLIKENDTIVVAVSGGPDSMVLFDVLFNLKNEYNLKLVVAHVNHNVRDESIQEYEFVSNIAKSYNIPFEGITLKNNYTGNFHNYAREKRYEFLINTCIKYNTNKIALAHHGDDQIETILMKINRGGSIKGYFGISPTTKYKNKELIRPLLLQTKEDILEYANINNVKYVVDQSNKSNKYTRNRYRNHVLPFLKSENPNVHKKYNQFSETLSEVNDLLEDLASKFILKHVLFNDITTIPVDYFNELNTSVKRVVLYNVINKITNDKIEISWEQLNSIIDITLNSAPNLEIHLDDNCLVSKEYNTIRILKRKDSSIIYDLKISDENIYLLPNGNKFILQKNMKYLGHNSIELCYNSKVFPIFVRNRKPGDKIKLDYGTKKVKDLFIDLKIPKSQRDNIPIVCDNSGNIIWIAGIKKASLETFGYETVVLKYEVKGEL